MGKVIGWNTRSIMKIKDILKESYSHPIIVVDVQPEYSRAINFEDTLMRYLNSSTGKVWIMYNGEEFTSDNKSSIAQYYFDNGLGNFDEAEWERKIRSFSWTDKGYAFFRGWMDSGATESVIISVLREMLRQHVSDSRNLFEGNSNLFEEFLGNNFEEYMIDEPLYFPPDVAISKLKSFSGAYICGGGQHECLKEIMILMSVFNIKYKLMKNFIY